MCWFGLYYSSLSVNAMKCCSTLLSVLILVCSHMSHVSTDHHCRLLALRSQTVPMMKLQVFLHILIQDQQSSSTLFLYKM